MSTIPSGRLGAVGDQWIVALRAVQTLIPAAKLYQGPSHAESKRAASASGYLHFIVSAGLGLISADTEVPNYSASILAGNDDIRDRLSDGDNADAWWRWLQRNSPFAQSLETVLAVTAGPCLIALPQAYLSMLRDDLLSLPSESLERIRIFSGSQAPAALKHLQMPYDDRLDGVDSPYKGTRSNFAPRAVRHFASHILPGRETDGAGMHIAAVNAALAQWRPPTRTVGQRKTDSELREILNANWDATGGRSTRMLRLFRDELGFACEQSRFARLVRDIRAERAKTV